jgi:hypothetical protein
MKEISTRVIMIGAASLLGVALVASSAYAARGSLTVADAPGQVLQISGVGPASAQVSPTATAHTSPTATAHTSPNAKGLSSATTARATTRATSQATATPQSGVSQVAPPAAQMLPTHHAEMHSPEPVHSPSHM